MRFGQLTDCQLEKRLVYRALPGKLSHHLRCAEGQAAPEESVTITTATAENSVVDLEFQNP